MENRSEPTPSCARRVGDAIERPPYQNAAFVRDLLTFFDECGCGGAPRHLGFAKNGSERVSFIPGQVVFAESLSVPQAESLGALLRRLHDATAGSSLAGGSEIVRHGDPGLQNALFDGEEAIALIDWEYAAPGTRLDELAELAWCMIEVGCQTDSCPFQVERLTAVCRGYNGPSLVSVVNRAAKQVVAASRRYSESAEAVAHFFLLKRFLRELALSLR